MSFFFSVSPENSDMAPFSGLIIPRFKALCCHNFVLVKIVVTYASLFFGALQKISSMTSVLGMENVSDEPRCRCFLRCPQKTATFGPNVIRHPCTDGLWNGNCYHISDKQMIVITIPWSEVRKAPLQGPVLSLPVWWEKVIVKTAISLLLQKFWSINDTGAWKNGHLRSRKRVVVVTIEACVESL